jgi:uncharacterized protein YqgC (DUF456 family)
MPLWVEPALSIVVLIGLLLTWIGTIVPIFPAPIVMWILILIYGIFAGFGLRGAIVFGVITVLAIMSLLTDEFFSIRGARRGGARWASVAIAGGVGLITSLLLTPIGGILSTVAALFVAEALYQHDTQKAWQATKQLIIGWGWATVARLVIGLIMILLWGAWAWG